MKHILIFFFINLFFLVLLFCTNYNKSFAGKYFYPVASLSLANTKNILFIQQETVDKLTLVSWNPKTTFAKKMLPARFLPAAVRVLPDQSGFSFIDNGCLYLQYLEKRSPKLISFCYPLHGFNAIEWITGQDFFCSAKRDGYYAIFQGSVNGIVQCIAAKAGGDCLYPQKVHNYLFYVERTGGDLDKKYALVKCNYPSIMVVKPEKDLEPEDEQFLVVHTPLVREREKNILLRKDFPITFLSMLNEQEGFFIEHAKSRDLGNRYMLFTYHYIYYTNAGWQDTSLFNFSLPTKLLFDAKERLYESLLPLLPYYYNGFIYYQDAIQEDTLSLYSYCLQSGVKKKIYLDIPHLDDSFVFLYANYKLLI